MRPEKHIIKNSYPTKASTMMRSLTWREQIRASVGYETALYEAIRRAIEKKYKEVADVVRMQGISRGIGAANRILYDDSIFQPLMKMYMDVAMYYAKRTYREVINRNDGTNKGIKMPIEWKSIARFEPIWRSAVETFLRQHGVTFVGDITNTTRKDLIRIMTKMSSANAGEMEVVNALIKSNIPAVRAMRIARTEITRALNAGILLAGAAMPFEVYKEWLTAEDENVRDKPFSHIALHGTVLPLNKPFNNGEEIRFPGDPLSSAENVINCRCTLNLLPNLDPLGRPIMRTENILDTDILFRLSDLF